MQIFIKGSMLSRVCNAFALLGLVVGVTACDGKIEPTSTMQDKPASMEKYDLTLAETWPQNFPIFGEAVKNMANMASTMSNGRLNITIDSKNKHKSAFGIFDMVKSGQYDMGHSASYYWKGKVPATMFCTTRPFGMIASEQYAWFYYGGGNDLCNEIYNTHNLYSFPGGNTGNQMGGWFQKEINSVDDLKGLKMRIPGFAGDVVASLGVNVQNKPAGELYTALERGTIDALEWVGPSLDLKMGFHKIAPYYYTGWHEPATELQFLLNKEKFDSLPADLQEILKVSMKAAAYDMYAQSMHESGKNLQLIRKDYPNIKLKTFPPAVMTALREANARLVKEYAEKDPLSQKILASQETYQAQIRAWTLFSDVAYLTK